MSISINDFIKRMLEFFPFTQNEYEKEMQNSFEGLDTIVIEDIFMPEVINILERNCDEELLKSIFAYFEEVSVDGDIYLLNVFSITALEILGNDRTLLVRAKKYMGPKTAELQYKADKALGRGI